MSDAASEWAPRQPPSIDDFAALAGGGAKCGRQGRQRRLGLGKVFQPVFDELKAKLLLASEIVIERSLRDAGLPQDLRQATLVVSLLQDDRDPCLEDRTAGVGPRVSLDRLFLHSPNNRPVVYKIKRPSSDHQGRASPR